MTRADAHRHLFANGYTQPDFPPLFGEREAEIYEAFRRRHGIAAALAVGYEAGGIDPGNNAHLRRLAATRPWLCTLAYVEAGEPSDGALIEAHLDAGHRGVAIYVPDEARAASVSRWPDGVWRALADRGALVSLNTRPPALARLAPLLEATPGVRWLVSHLGLPGALPSDIAPGDLDARLSALLALAPLRNVFVKVSGLYALGDPPHAFPHVGAQRAIALVLNRFGAARCVWGSDFSPALEFVSFGQTLDWHVGLGLDADTIAAVEGGTLMRLLGVQAEAISA